MGLCHEGERVLQGRFDCSGEHSSGELVCGGLCCQRHVRPSRHTPVLLGGGCAREEEGRAPLLLVANLVLVPVRGLRGLVLLLVRGFGPGCYRTWQKERRWQERAMAAGGGVAPSGQLEKVESGPRLDLL